jgi:hypothetical protein
MEVILAPFHADCKKSWRIQGEGISPEDHKEQIPDAAIPVINI